MASIAAETPIVPGDIWFHTYGRYDVITKLYGTTVETRSLKQPIAELKAKPNSYDISQPSRQYRLNSTFHKRGIRVGDRVSNSVAYRNGDTNNVVTGVVTELFFKNETLLIRVGDDGNELSASMFRVLTDEEGLGLTLNLPSMFRTDEPALRTPIPGDIWKKGLKYVKYVVITGKGIRVWYSKQLDNDLMYKTGRSRSLSIFDIRRGEWKFHKRGIRVGDRVKAKVPYPNGSVTQGIVTKLIFEAYRMYIQIDTTGLTKHEAGKFQLDEPTTSPTPRRRVTLRRKKIKGSIWGKWARGERVVVLDTKPLRYRKILTDEGLLVGPVLTDEDEFKKYSMKRRGPREGERWEDASDDYSVRVLNTWTVGDEEENLDIQYIADDSSFSDFMTIAKFIKTFTPDDPSEMDIYKKGNEKYYVANIKRGEGKRTYTLRKTNGRDPVEIMHSITSLDSPMLDNKFEFVQNGPRGVWYDEDAGDAIEIELSDYNKDDDVHKAVYIKRGSRKVKDGDPYREAWA